ncbi:Extracellular calcium-sensing receptor [Larimichthys crocea]|uniref:Extracellular calcium-sensing receptor n=1 Tax=Larimichthys crocea TaxID=215358 RepID=A0A6G0IUE8_LARCR|nr:Extracellular calcium-sensing receptor [Larimichthys crocea]
MTMAFAVDEINRNSNLLPNVTLGYSLYDNCVQLAIGFRAAMSLVSGQEEQFVLDETCAGTPPVIGVVGDSSSTRSIAISTVLGLYRVPMVSTMIQILKHFGWTWAGLLISDDDYGLHAARSFQSDFVQSGEGCLAYTEILSWANDQAELRRIVDVMKKSTARVVIVFAHENHVVNLMEEVVRQNVTGLQWIASEAWIAATIFQTSRLIPHLAGTLGIAIRRGELPGLRDFLLQIRPDLHGNENSLVKLFWEYTFQCRFAPPPAGWVEAGGTICTGQEDLQDVDSKVIDMSNLRPEYNVYKAVYALAYALDDMLQCEPGRGPFSGNSCGSLKGLEPWQLVYYLQKVNFTTPFGDQVSFDENGDALPIYDIMNWLWLPDGRAKLQNVGDVKKSAFKDSIECTSCPEDFWSSPQRDHCVPKKTEFLSYHEPLGFRQAMTMAFAIDEINRNSNLLPNVTLGYSLYDICVKLGIGFRAAMSLVSGQEEQFILNETCAGTPPVIGIVGDPSSTRSIAISTVLGLYRVPMVSYFATCSCLSDRQKFPSFFRTIPSDAFQVRAMIQILKHFGWTWVGLLVSDDDYGRHAARSFQSDLAQSGGGCLAYLEFLPWSSSPSELRRIVNVMKKSTARVVIVFAHESHMINLMEEVRAMIQILKHFGWTWAGLVISDDDYGLHAARSFQSDFVQSGEGCLAYTEILSWANDQAELRRIVGVMKKSTARVVIVFASENHVVNLMEEVVRQNVTGLQWIASEAWIAATIFQTSRLIPHLAGTLGIAIRRGELPGLRDFLLQIRPDLHDNENSLLVYYLQKVNFTTPFGDQVSFDENGDALPIYDIMNWLWLPDGRAKLQNVGDVKKSAFKDSIECTSCPEDFWSSPQRDHCVPKKTEFLSYHEPLGICLTATSLLGTCICAIVLVIFIYHRATPIVRANNSD